MMRNWNQQVVVHFCSEMRVNGHHPEQLKTDHGWFYYCPYCEITFDPDVDTISECVSDKTTPLFEFSSVSHPFGKPICHVIVKSITDWEEFLNPRQYDSLSYDKTSLIEWMQQAGVGETTSMYKHNTRLSNLGNYGSMERVR